MRWLIRTWIILLSAGLASAVQSQGLPLDPGGRKFDPSAPSAGAQPDGKFVGRWQCQYVSRSSTGDRSVNYAYYFDLELSAGERFDAQGNYYAETAGFNQGFRANGQWQSSGDRLVANGQAQLPSWTSPFVFQLTHYSPGNASFQTQTQLGTLAIACIR